MGFVPATLGDAAEVVGVGVDWAAGADWDVGVAWGAGAVDAVVGVNTGRLKIPSKTSTAFWQVFSAEGGATLLENSPYDTVTRP